MEEEKILEVRAYYFVPYNISQMQMGIQAGHAGWRYARRFSADNPEIWDFVDYHETTIILNGGTTNSRRDFDGKSLGTLNQIADSLLENDIQFSHFEEPDLNDALTALCFLADERVFNRKDYPDFLDYIFDVKMYPDARSATPEQNYIMLKMQTAEHLQEMFPEYYKEWVRFVGGVKNVFLRDLIKGKELAK
jgi:hypothetical protein